MNQSLYFETSINQRPEIIFDLLADLRGYAAWLPRSVIFNGTSSISPGPIAVGTSYVEKSLWGTRRGTVTEMNRPSRLSFHQPMTLRPAWIGNVDIRLYHELIPSGASTRLIRTLDLDICGPARLFSRVILRGFISENHRMLAKLKAYAESPRASDVSGEQDT